MTKKVTLHVTLDHFPVRVPPMSKDMDAALCAICTRHQAEGYYPHEVVAEGFRWHLFFRRPDEMIYVCTADQYSKEATQNDIRK